MLLWACNIHEIHGLSLTSAVVSFDQKKQKSFEDGQMYVAFRVISSESLSSSW